MLQVQQERKRGLIPNPERGGGSGGPPLAPGTTRCAAGLPGGAGVLPAEVRPPPRRRPRAPPDAGGAAGPGQLQESSVAGEGGTGAVNGVVYSAFFDARAQLQPVLRAQGDQATGGGNKAPGVDTRDEVAVFARAAEALERARRLEGAAVRVSVYGIDHLICLVGVVPGVHHKNCNTTSSSSSLSPSPARPPAECLGWISLQD